MKPNRNGFTLTELLVVIGILLAIAAMAFAIFNSGRSSDRMRSGARTAQSAFLAAKDRALHAKDYRGVRLTRDSANLNVVNGFVYLQPLPAQFAGNGPSLKSNDVAIVVNSVLPNPSVQLAIGAPDGANFLNQDTQGLWQSGNVQVQLGGGAGKWYFLQQISNTAPFYGTMSGGNLFLTIAVAFDPITGIPIGPAGPNGAWASKSATASDSSVNIRTGNDLLPFQQPITLPSGCVIDLAFSSANVQMLAWNATTQPLAATPYLRSPPALPSPIPNIDVMFSPRGNVIGTTAALGTLYFCVRTIQDAGLGLDPAYDKRDPAYPQTMSDCLILAVFPQTGLVQTYDADLTDNFINFGANAGTAGSDGAADNIFSYAQRGQSAGR